MKTLYLMRHAQAAAAPPMENDHTRPLTRDGRTQGAALKAFMTEKKICPDLVLSSDSLRTLETAELSGLTEITRVPGLYLAAANDIAGIIQAAPDETASLMIIGHNPGLAEFSMSLSGDEIYFFMPGTLAVFTTTAVSWLLMSPENTQLKEIYTP